MITPFETVREALQSRGYRITGSGSNIKAQCPAHEDGNPSLSIREGRDGGALLYCHAGCSTAGVMSELGLSMRDLFSEEYRYEDASGTPVRISDHIAIGGLTADLPTVIDGDRLLTEVETLLARYVVYPGPHERVAHVLWVAHTHLMDCWESTPRIAFLSPEPGSGKSRALEVSEPLVPRPVHAVNATPAYLFRKISDPDGPPTVLFDEIDTLFGPKDSLIIGACWRADAE